MDRRRLWHRIRRVWITLGLTMTAVFVIWSLISYRASPEARAALVSDSVVTVRHAGGIWHFTPSKVASESPVALVFFPGALVDPVAYAPLTRAAAAAGYETFLIELPRRGAFGGAESPELRARLSGVLGDKTIDQSKSASGARGRRSPARWVVAGHSRGAVVATQVAARGMNGLAGVVLIGTSHPRDVDLAGLAVPVTKIVGMRDGLASPSEVEANRRLLPASTRWIRVEGGNHSQFGWYGFQPGDRRATTPASEQRALMIRGVLEALAAAASRQAGRR